MAIDPVHLSADLIRCPSVTPEEGGAIALLVGVLSSLGFACHRISRGGVQNLYARWGTAQPVFAFAGHTDVVPVGDAAAWSRDPFGGEIVDGMLWGRGATDMKSGVAAFVAAAAELVAEEPPGSIALIITGDEEGPAIDGTTAILDWMVEQGERADFCLVGEPTSVAELGDTAKIGRRGSLNGVITVIGRQGHSAYPERAANPLSALARIAAALAETPLDEGSEHFQPSTLALTSIDVGNSAANVIPAQGRAAFNIRFNDCHTSANLKAWADETAQREIAGSDLTVQIDWSGTSDSFLTAPSPRVEAVADAIATATNRRPALTTGGGTSDARFIKDLCPVIEFGLVGDTMHQVDERVPVAQIQALSRIYLDILRRFFA
ncbi:MAG: succinyl-diaminopimelate desuccinylase [Paracoccaceae bacterium]|nr:succinyl-diaminopimelate desuccinylase [Paracoccaceae bacterium]